MPRRPRFLDKSPQTISIPSSEPALLRLVILRALCKLGCTAHFVREHCFDQDGVASLLGLEDLAENYDRKQALTRIRRWLN